MGLLMTAEIKMLTSMARMHDEKGDTAGIAWEKLHFSTIDTGKTCQIAGW